MSPQLVSTLALPALLLGGCAALLGAAAPLPERSSTGAPAPASPAAQRLSFEPALNSAAGSAYVARGAGYALELLPDGASVTLAVPKGAGRSRRAQLRVRFPGADASARGRGEGLFPGRSTYITGRDPSRWRRDVPAYARVCYPEVYPGVDLVYHGKDRSLEYDFVLRPGAEPDRVRLRMEDEAGRVQLPTLTPSGELMVRTAGGEVRQSAPFAYQEEEGRRVQVACSYLPLPDAPGELGFQVGEYDRSRPLVIDPVLRYFTDETALTSSLAIDRQGFIYVTGSSWSPNPEFYGNDVFVRKFSPDGQQLLYSFFVGGEEWERAGGIAVDSEGAAYVTGNTSSVQFPVTAGAFQSRLAWTPEDPSDIPSTTDAFAAKINPEGNGLVYATYIGGHWLENDWTWGGIAVDGQGNAYVVGDTASGNFPTTPGALRPSPGGAEEPLVNSDSFLVKLNGTGAAVYSTMFGGSSVDLMFGVGVDEAQSPILVGLSGSDDLPIRNAFQATHQGNGDAAVAKLTPDGGDVVYCTFLGGEAYEWGRAIAVDGTGAACVAGETSSPDFPTVAPFQATIGGERQEWGGFWEDAFMARLDPNGNVIYSTYVGGRGVDRALAITADAQGAAAITGRTESPDFPTHLAEQPEIGWFDREQQIPTTDGFVTMLEPTGTLPVFSTFVGGGLADEGRGIGLTPGGDVFLSGNSIAGEFGYLSLPGAKQRTRGLRVQGRRVVSRPRVQQGEELKPFITRLRNPRPAGPALQADVETLAFGRVRLGSWKQLQVRLTNTGGTVIDARIRGAGLPFRVLSGGGAFRLRPGQSRVVTVAFKPWRRRRYRSRLNVNTGAAGGPLRIKLQGRGVW